MDAVTQVPVPVNETVLDYAPGSPERARSRSRSPSWAAPASSCPTPSAASGSWAPARRSTCASRTPAARSWGPCATPPSATPRLRSMRPRRRHRAGVAVLRRPRGHPAQGGRAALRAMAGPPQRRDDAGAVQDRLPGRDRRRLRADRLLAHQRPLRAADPRRAAAAQLQGHLEPHRPPPARGLRLRDHAVQLHRHRRQPADRPCAHGQHRRLEAQPDPAVRRPPDHGAARGGRHAAGRHQHGDRRRAQRLQGRARRPRPRRHPLHRLDADLPAPVAGGRRQPAELPHLPATRRRDRRQGLHPRPPLGRPGRAAHGHDSRRLRVPGPEVLRRLARLRAALAVEEDQGRPRLDHRRPEPGRRHRPVQLHGRRHRRARVRQAPRRDRPGPRHRRASRSSPVARTTTPRATSSARPSWRSTTRPTSRSAPSTSARSCPSTSTPTASTTRCSTRWSRSRPTG